MRQQNAGADDRLRAVWAMLEARRIFPALIAVAGATDQDDTAIVAATLLRVAMQAGRRVAAVEFGAPPISKRTHHEAATLSEPSTVHDFDAALSDWRERYDAIVVSIPNALAHSVRTHAVGVADCIVVSICGGRDVTVADRNLRMLVNHVPAKVLGVVTTPRARWSAKHNPAISIQDVPERAAVRQSAFTRS